MTVVHIFVVVSRCSGVPDHVSKKSLVVGCFCGVVLWWFCCLGLGLLLLLFGCLFFFCFFFFYKSSHRIISQNAPVRRDV